MQRPIAVFDSGVGGLAVLKKMKNLLPHEDFLYFADNKNAPYGTKEKRQIEKIFFSFVPKIIESNPKAIVIACNTVTSICIERLRKELDTVLIFGVQPAIKQAKKPCLVFVTPATAKSQSFCEFAKSFDAYVLPLKYGASLIEKGCDDAVFFNYLKNETEGIVLDKFASVVLGCTHYSHKEKCFKKLGLPVFDGADGLANHTRVTILSKGLCQKTSSFGGVTFCLSDNSVGEFCKYIRLYNELNVF